MHIYNMHVPIDAGSNYSRSPHGLVKYLYGRFGHSIINYQYSYFYNCVFLLYYNESASLIFHTFLSIIIKCFIITLSVSGYKINQFKRKIYCGHNNEVR